jgi:hypothetical protein
MHHLVDPQAMVTTMQEALREAEAERDWLLARL